MDRVVLPKSGLGFLMAEERRSKTIGMERRSGAILKDSFGEDLVRPWEEAFESDLSSGSGQEGETLISGVGI